MGVARGEEGACEGLGIARQPETLPALLEIDEQIRRTPEQPEERGLARLPGAEDQPGLPRDVDRQRGRAATVDIAS